MQRESRGLTIRSRLILAGLAPAAVALLIACSAFLASELYFFPREVGVSLGRLAEMIGDNSSAALVFDDRSVTGSTARKSGLQLSHRSGRHL